MTLRTVAPLLVALPLVACQTKDGDTDDTDTDTDVVVNDFCEKNDLPTQAFQTEGAVAELDGLAGDFTAKTLSGDWTFSEQFTGCSSYVFFVHFPGTNDALFESDLYDLFDFAGTNVEYFFVSDSDDRPERNAFIEGLEARIDEAIKEVVDGPAKRRAWRERVHLVTQKASKIDGSVGAFLTHMLELSADPEQRADLGDRGQAPVPLPEVFGIDRDQRFDAGGNLSPYVGAPGDELGMGVWLPRFYDYRFDLDQRLNDTDGATVVSVLDSTNTDRIFVVEADLPSADTMAGFDTLAFDVTIDCREVNPFACSEWDRIAAIQLCTDGEACESRQELARWITPYWRRGRQRYALEASPMLALLRDGGSQWLRIELGPSWERATEWYTAVSLRMSDQGGPRPVAAVPAFTGGNFDAAYNEREPVAFTPPAGTSKAEVVAIISGHGQTSGDNCAEWCDHRHTFSIDDTPLDTIVHEGPTIGSGIGCAERADNGVIPGQWGNWAQMRAYWCPGMAVTPHRLDITSQVTAGTESAIDYTASFGEGPPQGGSIALSSYVVFYEDP